MKNIIFEKLEKNKCNVVKTLHDITSIPAISPLAGGKGESAKVKKIMQIMKELKFPAPEIYEAKDETAENGVRPSLVYRVKGKTDKKLWIMTHTDVVPVGNIKLWNTDPFDAIEKDGRLYGRGVNDNGQELVASIYALHTLMEENITPEYEICLCFVADEEIGSKYGIQYLLQKGLFSPDDLIIVPDGGNEAGNFIEVAEKGICWLEFTITGRQVHASTPHLGINSCRCANEFSYRLDNALHLAFPEENTLFVPAISTFEPTKRIENVPNINTVPGRDTLCFDCRLLPGIEVKDIETVIDTEIKKMENKTGVTISYTYVQKESAPEATSPDAPVVQLLKKSVEQVIKDVITVGGVGGGTCAAFLRRAGIPAVVWAKEADVAHMPNEYVVIEDIIDEMKVFALTMCGGNL